MALPELTSVAFKATVNTRIPRASVTDLECLMLREHGFNCELLTDETGCEVYLFYTDTPPETELAHKYGAGSADIQKAIKDPLNAVYFTGDSGVDIDNKSYYSIFQHIISRTKNLDFIEIEGVFAFNDHSRRAGGFAELITRDNVVFGGTARFLLEARAQLSGQHGRQLADIAPNEYQKTMGP